MYKKICIFLLVLSLFGNKSQACTSVIVSARVTVSGKPLMLKHRDTDFLDNKMVRIAGEKYDFVALANASDTVGEVWAGTNTAGFCIMNTATYDLKDDDVPFSEMDKEGFLMHRALEICSSVKDFEVYLDTLRRPMGVEANFGVIDAIGGAAYYEVNNHSWVKFDVNDASVAPDGYMVVTNFTRTGRVEDRKGVDRFDRACEIMATVPRSFGKESFGKIDIDYKYLINRISRSGKPIERDITSASIVFEGVEPGRKNPCAVMWTVLGFPSNAPIVPLIAVEKDNLPDFMKHHSLDKGSAGEDELAAKFKRIYEDWASEKIRNGAFYRKYDAIMTKFYDSYRHIVVESDKND